jgi:hypothetical protein
MTPEALRLGPHGAELRPSALSGGDLRRVVSWADEIERGPGRRLFGHAALSGLAGPRGPLQEIAAAVLGEEARAVRAVLFDKTPDANWAVAWHQDRTIAVRARADADGFGPWSTKDGLQHVEPPFEVLQGMVTLRAHLDPCGTENAPLLVAPGSHRLGLVPAAEASAAAQRLGAVACLASPGDVWLYATPILHASERARTPGRRRVLQVDFAARPLPDGLEWLGID